MLKVRVPDIFRRLVTRFGLEEPLISEQTSLSKAIIPVTNIDELLKTAKIGQTTSWTRTSAAGAGGVTCYQVPSGKRVKIFAMSLIRASGDGTLTQISLSNAANDAASTIYILTQGAAASWEDNIFNPPLELDQDLRINAYVNAITSDSAWTTRLYYLEEDAF